MGAKLELGDLSGTCQENVSAVVGHEVRSARLLFLWVSPSAFDAVGSKDNSPALTRVRKEGTSSDSYEILLFINSRLIQWVDVVNLICQLRKISYDSQIVRVGDRVSSSVQGPIGYLHGQEHLDHHWPSQQDN